MTSEQWDKIIHFKPSEFSEPFSMDWDFIFRLDHAREYAGVPFELNSTYREGDPLSHGRGLAVDIKCTNSTNRYKILTGVIQAGFKRIGVYDRHIHVDADTSLPQEVVWWGKSK